MSVAGAALRIEMSCIEMPRIEMSRTAVSCSGA